jgi:oligo-1,6-glucosidase
MERKYFKEKVIYQIYPRSFADSNDDGIGDLNGITSKLDYLKDLGVGIIWLSPIYDSPLDDMGYDVRNYFEIHKDYGTMEDFDNLIKEAKKRNIRVVMDLVVNHTSDENKYFTEALKDPNSPYRKWYYFRKGRGKNGKKAPNNWQSIFTGSAWEELKNEPGMYYLHLYGKKQPDLDFHNEEVIKEVEKILTYWLDKGVYGFRCDVIDQIYKTSLENGRFRFLNTGLEHYLCQKGNHDVLKRFRQDVFSHYDTVVIGENAFMTYDQGKEFMQGDELDMFFQFDHMNIDKCALPIFRKKFKVKNLRYAMFRWEEEVSWNAIYFENHDQLRSIDRFGNPQKYYKESGKALATLLITIKGTPFIYNGQEIGMLDYDHINEEDINDVSVKNVARMLKHVPLTKRQKEKLEFAINRDNVRSPMAWSNSINAGFCPTAKPWLKANEKYKLGINVADNEKDPESILNYYKKLISLRNNDEILQYGEFVLHQSNKNLIVYSRVLDNHEYFVIINLSKKNIKIKQNLNNWEKIIENTCINQFVGKVPPYYAGVYKVK